MAHEQEFVPLQAAAKDADKRWPVPYAVLFITGVSVALWAAIIAVTGWLLG